MARRRRSYRKHHTIRRYHAMHRYHMRRRGSKQKGDLDWLAKFITGYILLVIGLLLSDNPKDKNWGLNLGVFGVVFWSCGNAGISVGLGLVISFVSVVLLNLIRSNISKSEVGEQIRVRNREYKKERTYKKEQQITKLETKNHSVAASYVEKGAQDVQNPIAVNENKVKEKTKIKSDSNAVKASPSYYESVQDAVKERGISAEYRKIMIESVDGTDIFQCPGLAWKDDEKLYVLPLRKGEDIVEILLDDIGEIRCEKRVNIDFENDYVNLNSSKIAEEFEEYYPEYYFGEDGTWTEMWNVGGVKITGTSRK